MKMKSGIIMTLVMALLLTAGCALAEQSGTCGDNLTWRLDDAGTLTISGSGDMDNYVYIQDPAPWHDRCAEILSVTVEEGVTSIGDAAFMECSSLVSATLPSGVRSIGDNAFDGCSGLESVTLPSGLESIGAYAFYECSQLTDMTLPDSVTSIGMWAFYGCSSLESVTIPQGMTAIDAYTFQNCKSLTSVVIPQNVTIIGVGAFQSCTSLTDVTIAQGVITINGGAFALCKSLTELTLPDSVESIGMSAFLGCESLREIAIPEGVTAIADKTFEDCGSLESVTLPDSVTSIGSNAFAGCAALEITLPDGMTDMGTGALDNVKRIWCNPHTDTAASLYRASSAYRYSVPDYPDFLLYDPDGVTTLDQYTGEGGDIGIPGGVNVIAPAVFRDCQTLTGVTIPDSVTSIGDNAFAGCAALEITLPDGMTDMGTGALDNVKRIWCNPHTDTAASLYRASSAYRYSVPDYPDFLLYDPDGVTTLDQYTGEGGDIGIPGGVNVIAPAVFRDCQTLTGVTIPDSVTSIGDNAFAGCAGLEQVTIPGSVTSLENGVFNGCTGLTAVTLQAGLQSVGSYAFNGCTGLEKVTIPSGVTAIGSYAFNGCVSMTSASLPDSVTSIGSYAFMDCRMLTEVTIPAGVTTIGYGTFSGCGSLSRATIHQNVTDIGSNAFADCSSLTEVTIPAGVTTIGYGTFSGCSSLTEIVIPDGVTKIGNSAFEGCSSLTEMVIPTGVTGIGYGTFRGCSSLTEMVIPTGVTVIESGVFEDCSSLRRVTIPYGVTSIGSSAFSRCTSLATLTLPESVTGIGSYAFEDCSSLTSVTIPEGVNVIKTAVFRRCTSMTDVVLPQSVTSIEHSAFAGCSSLQKVTIPEGVTTIANCTFQGCTGLTAVVLPQSVTSIEYNAFERCSSLTDVTLPEGLTSMEQFAFFNCSSLQALTVPSGITALERFVFSGCSQLEITLPDGITALGDSALGVKSIICNPHTVTTATLWSLYYRYCLAGQPDFRLHDEGEDTVLDSYEGAGGEVLIPALVTRIGNYAFYGCTALTGVTIPESVTSISYYAFNGCTALTDVTIPAGVTSIGYYAFNGCTALTDVTIPAGVTSVGDHLFNKCTGLERVTILGSIAEIPAYMFADCASLTDVTIPEDVTAIGSYAFNGCTQLTLTLPDGITSVGESAFRGVTKLCCTPLTETSAALGSAGYSYCMAGHEEYQLLEEGTSVRVVDYSGPVDAVVIPSPINSWQADDAMVNVCLPATLDGGCAFSLTAQNVTVPQGVTNPGALTLTNAQKLYLPDSVETFDGVTFADTQPVIYCSEGSAAEAWAMFSGYSVCNDAWESVCTLTWEGGLALDVGESATLDAADFVLSPIPEDYQGIITLASDALTIDGMTVTAQEPGDATLTAWMDGRFSVEIPVHVYQPVERVALKAPTLCLAGESFTVTVEELAPEDISGRLTWEQDGALVYEGTGLSLTLTAPGDQAETVVRVTAPGGVATEVTVRVPETISAPYLRSAVVEMGSLVELCVDVDGETFVNDPQTYGAISLGSAEGLVLEDGLVRTTAVGRYAFAVTSLSGTAKYFIVTVQDTEHACRTQVAAKAPTCTELGNTAYEICEGCGGYFVAEGDVLTAVEEGSWVIPAVGYHRLQGGVCTLCGETFDFTGMNVLTLPAAMKRIEAEAFRGSVAQVIVVPADCLSIGQNAFADCAALRYAVLPEALVDSAAAIFGDNVPVLLVDCGDAE
ncbi:MAG: leucine-rich repeat domain-containing protein [Aristaeellaceae bacterium]